MDYKSAFNMLTTILILGCVYFFSMKSYIAYKYINLRKQFKFNINNSKVNPMYIEKKYINFKKQIKSNVNNLKIENPYIEKRLKSFKDIENILNKQIIVYLALTLILCIYLKMIIETSS